MLLIYIIIYLISVLLYLLEHKIIASVMMIMLAIFLYVMEVRRTKRPINIRGLFALGFVGGFGVSLLKLSKLSDDYSFITLIAVFLAYFSIYVGVFFAERKKLTSDSKEMNNEMKITISSKLLLISLFVITFLAFAIEVMILRFIPLFTIDTPHAYSTFHVFVIHYITSFYSFVPCIAICNYYAESKNKDSIRLIILSFVYVVIMSLLLVSRSRLILSVVLAMFTVLIFESKNKNILKGKNKIILAGATFVFLALYIVITINRAHNVEYLNGIFEMKDENMPIFISQPYMYIAHNFENLNYMINNIFRWTFGRRMLYPLFTLTLIKKFFPIVVDAPYYIIKPELSTVTLIYDFYYDFGLVGIVVFCFLIGYIGKRLEDKGYMLIEKRTDNNYMIVLLAYYSYIMFFSFFQTYFSLTDTWVYIIILLVLSKLFIIKE